MWAGQAAREAPPPPLTSRRVTAAPPRANWVNRAGHKGGPAPPPGPAPSPRRPPPPPRGRQRWGVGVRARLHLAAYPSSCWFLLALILEPSANSSAPPLISVASSMAGRLRAVSDGDPRGVENGGGRDPGTACAAFI